MSIEDVRSRWNRYRLEATVLYTGINRPNLLDDVEANIGPFPEHLTKRSEWLHACSFLIALNQAIEVTDGALQRENDFVSATNEIASKVRLPAPAKSDVDSLLRQLHIVNRRIQQDDRWEAALRIGTALADEVGKQLRKT
jgi:hypothetical protein